MTTLTQEIVSIVRDLPEDKAIAVRDFAAFLRLQTKTTKTEPEAPARVSNRKKKLDPEAQWRRTEEDTRPRPKLEELAANARKALKEGRGVPLDESKL